MRPIAERRSCRSQARSTGVCPEGAQVRRRTGCSMKPLSSKKTMGSPRRLAPFLYGANPACAIVPRPRRPLRGPAVRAFGKSSPGRGAACPREPGDTPREMFLRSPRPPADTSKGRYDIRPFADRPREFRSVAVSASCRDGAFVRDVVLLSGLPSLLTPHPDATVSRNRPKHQPFPPPRRRRCLRATSALPASDEPPRRLRFLSVS